MKNGWQKLTTTEMKVKETQGEGVNKLKEKRDIFFLLFVVYTFTYGYAHYKLVGYTYYLLAIYKLRSEKWKILNFKYIQQVLFFLPLYFFIHSTLAVHTFLRMWSVRFLNFSFESCSSFCSIFPLFKILFKFFPYVYI